MATNAQTLDDKLKNLNIVDIGVAILGDRVKKRPISPDYRGLCPFHVENNPSFYLKARWNTYKCFGCDIEGTPLLFPFQFLRDYEEALSFFENKLGFSRNNIMEMAVFKWYAYSEVSNPTIDHGISFSDWEFLERFKPFEDWDRLEMMGGFHLETMYRAALEGAVDLTDYLQRIEPKD